MWYRGNVAVTESLNWYARIHFTVYSYNRNIGFVNWLYSTNSIGFHGVFRAKKMCHNSAIRIMSAQPIDIKCSEVTRLKTFKLKYDNAGSICRSIHASDTYLYNFSSYHSFLRMITRQTRYCASVLAVMAVWLTIIESVWHFVSVTNRPVYC